MMSSDPDGFDQRRQRLFDRGIEEDGFGAKAIYWLTCGRQQAEANAMLRRYADWFQQPIPPGANPQENVDFAAIKLCRAFRLFQHGDALDADTTEAIRQFFLKRDFASIYQSENHALLFHVSRLLIAETMHAETFVAYGRTGEEICTEDRNWIARFLRYRAAYGWGEFDSPIYLFPDWECLTCLYDFSADEELKKLSGMMMNLLLADMAAESLDGMYCGAHGRIYPPHALDHATTPAAALYYLYFGGREPREVQGYMIDAMTCGFRPDAVVKGIPENRSTPYENRERKHLHNVADVLPCEPLPGSIRKYSYWTPTYVLGCVQRQDAYPANGTVHHPHHSGLPVPPEQRVTAGYAHHQQHEWDLSFVTRTDARLFVHHPGKDATHNEWTGDRQCGCGQFLQSKSALIATYDISAVQPCPFIHANVPRTAFDEVVEEGRMIFVRAGETFAALLLSSDYHWTSEGHWAGREIISRGLRHGVACEAGTAGEFGDFARFRDEIRANRMTFDPNDFVLEYHSKRAGRLRLEHGDARQINGQDVNLDYPAYDNPFLRSEWGSGLITLRSPVGERVLDFNHPEMG